MDASLSLCPRLAVLASLLCLCATAQQADWQALSGNWSWAGADPTSGSGTCLLQLAAPPPCAEVSVRATVVPGQSAARNWCAAAVVVRGDDLNYWRLALVQNPTDPDLRYAEVVEMHQGVWQAQSEPATRLGKVARGEFKWDYGTAYDLRLTLTEGRVEGVVSEAGGPERYRCSYDLPAGVPAVREGWPALQTVDMVARFSGLDAECNSPVGARGPLPEGVRAQAVVLTDALPGADPRVAGLVAEAATACGLEVVALTARELCRAGSVDWRAVDLLAIPECQVLPLAAKAVVLSYVKGGGHLLVTGGPAFETWLYEAGGKWMTASEALAQVEPDVHLFTFAESGSDDRWVRATNDSVPAATATLEPGPAGATGGAMRHALAGFSGWSTWSRNMDGISAPLGHSITTFWAKGDAATTHMIVEWKEADGTRWIASAPVGTEWKRVALRDTDFRFWPDGAGPGRGGPGDRLEMERVATLTYGLAKSHSPLKDGPKTLWVADFGLAQSPLGGGDDGPLKLESLSPWYKTYEPPGVASIPIGEDMYYTQPGKVICSIPRQTRNGFVGGRAGRWIAYATAEDGERRVLGTPVWGYLSLAADSYGAMWSCMGLEAKALLGNREGSLALLQAIIARRQDGLWLVEGGSDQFSYRPGEARTLGAEVINLSREARTAYLVFGSDGELPSARSKDVIAEAVLAPGERRRISTDWRDAVEGWVVAEAALYRDAEYRDALDFALHQVHFVKPPQSPQFVTQRDGEFWLGNKQWYAHGCNYWPLYVSGMEPGAYWGHWLTPRYYEATLIEKDLALAEKLGFTSLSIALGTVDQLPCLWDFLARCKRHGLKVNLSLPGASPDDFNEGLVRDILTRGRLAESDALWAYEIAWEPRWGTQKERARHDADWRAWIAEQYGDVGSAEQAWGFAANRDDSGEVVGVTDQQLTTPGDWRAMVAAYRRFVDDYLSRRYNHACRVIRSLDPNHLIGHRVGYGGTGSIWAVSSMAYDPLSGARHLDFISPEGWGLDKDWEQFKSAGFITAYCRWAGNGKPVFWSEFGKSLHPGYTPEEFAHQADIHKWLCEMVLLSEAHGDASWWWPGGYRTNEDSDFGIIHPWGAPRPAAEALAEYASRICAPRKPASYRATIRMDRDKWVQGLAGAWQEFGARYAKTVKPGVGVDVVTRQTGKTSANVPLRALGGGAYTGVGPVQGLNGEFDRIELRVGEGEWTEVAAAPVRAPAGAPLAVRVRAGNTGEAKWLSGEGKRRVWLVVTTPAGEVRAPLVADVPRYGGGEFAEARLPALAPGTHEVSCRLSVQGRVDGFGQRAGLTVVTED